MRSFRAALATVGMILVSVSVTPSAVRAQLGVGVWERQPTKGSKGAVGSSMTMTVEKCCNGGYRLTYHITMNKVKSVMKVESPFDGTDVPVSVDGKTSGQTMALKRVDDRHYTAVQTMNGRPFGTSKGTLSPDGKTLTVTNDMSGSTQTEVWIKK